MSDAHFLYVLEARNRDNKQSGAGVIVVTLFCAAIMCLVAASLLYGRMHAHNAAHLSVEFKALP